MGNYNGAYGGGGGGLTGGGLPSTDSSGIGYKSMGYGGQPYTGMSQQPAYGMGTGGQYSPQLRQAQTAWQNQYTGGQQQPIGGLSQTGNVWTGRIEPMTYEDWSGRQQTGDTTQETYAKYADPLNARNAGIEAAQKQQQPPQFGGGNPWMSPSYAPRMGLQQQGNALDASGQRVPYGMGAQGNGNAYGYGGQQGNPWAQMLAQMQQPQQQGSTSLAPPAAPPADWNGQAGYDFRHNPATNPNIRPQALAAAQPPMQAAPAMPTSFSGINNLPRGAYQIPGYGGTPSAAPPPQAAAAPTRAQYSPNNPFGGLYSNPQADAWEQQQRGGGAPAAAAPVPATPVPAAPGTDVMRKALAAGSGANQGTTNGYGYGTPGGYQLDTAPSTLDPGSMNALLGIMGGNINGVGYPTSAANYANWYQQTYGTQAPGGAPRAYPF
jgi:hypothetical protein